MLVTEIKALIMSHGGVPIRKQRLFVGTRCLADDDTLGSAINLVDRISLMDNDPRISEAEELAKQLTACHRNAEKVKILKALCGLEDGACYQADVIAAQLGLKNNDGDRDDERDHFHVKAQALLA